MFGSSGKRGSRRIEPRFDDSAEDSTNLLIAIDPANQRVFTAMQDGGEAPRLYPPMDQWPASLQEKLKQWL